MNTYFVNLIFICLSLLTPEGDSDWKLKKEDGDIKIYTRNIQGSVLAEFKGVATFQNTSMNKILDIILDVPNYSSLFPDCLEAKVLEQKGKYYDIHYFAVKAPWPVKNRDAIYESVTTITEDGKHAHVALNPLGKYLEVKKDFIRMFNGSGFWELEELETNTIRVTYQFHGDPAGDLPAWLVNSAVVYSPLKTFHNLQSKIK